MLDGLDQAELLLLLIETSVYLHHLLDYLQVDLLLPQCLLVERLRPDEVILLDQQYYIRPIYLSIHLHVILLHLLEYAGPSLKLAPGITDLEDTRVEGGRVQVLNLGPILVGLDELEKLKDPLLILS